MWNFIDNAKRLLWELVELGFVVLLAVLLIGLLLGQSAGAYVTSVTENVTKFAASASSGLIGIVILLAIIFLVMQRRAKA